MFTPKMSFAHISYTSFQIQMSSSKMLHKRNCMRTQTLKKLTDIGLYTHQPSNGNSNPVDKVHIQQD